MQRTLEVSRMEACRVETEQIARDIVPVDAENVRDPVLLEDMKPGTDSTSEVDDGVRLRQFHYQRNDLFRRPLRAVRPLREVVVVRAQRLDPAIRKPLPRGRSTASASYAGAARTRAAGSIDGRTRRNQAGWMSPRRRNGVSATVIRGWRCRLLHARISLGHAP